MALDHDSLHELWRLQLLDELRRRRVALEYEPQLDPDGRRRAALAELIDGVEDEELQALEELNGKEAAPPVEREGATLTRTSILVAYGTKKGSTAEVATFVGKRLRRQGLVVDVREAAEVEDLASYDGVVLGGSISFGRWHDDARAFLDRFRTALAGRPLAVFALGPETAESRAQLDRALGDVEPITVAVSDARDWTAIAAWADEIASLVTHEEVRV